MPAYVRLYGWLRLRTKLLEGSDVSPPEGFPHVSAFVDRDTNQPSSDMLLVLEVHLSLEKLRERILHFTIITNQKAEMLQLFLN